MENSNAVKKPMVALLSLYNKDGLVDFAKELDQRGIKMLASGGTAKKIAEAGLPVTDVAELIGGGAILGHKVVTLSREIAAALLSDDSEEEKAELARIGVPRIDIVCSNLYPLEEEIAKPDSTEKTVIEKTDIGGPTLLREAAKGRRVVICDPEDYEKVLEWIDAGQPDKEAFLRRLAAKAEFAVAKYALASAKYLGQGDYDGVLGEKILACKYGENGWQTPAGLYSSRSDDKLGLDRLEVKIGTDPSYNNMCDADRLTQTVTHIVAGFQKNRSVAPYVAVAVKHGNACGAAAIFPQKGTKREALESMIKGDTRAIFGGLVMVNFDLDQETAETLLTYLMPEGKRRLLDGIIAPSIAEETFEMLKRKGDKCRLIVNPALGQLDGGTLDLTRRIRYVRGGFLTQPNYDFVPDFFGPDMAKTNDPSDQQIDDMILAWAIGSTSNSNTITLVKNGQLIGNGVAQQDRVGAAKVACFRADESGHDISGAAAYSDSFYPFNDGVEELAKRGVKAIFATSGSVNDKNMIEYAEKSGIALVMMPDSLCRGFFGH